MTFSRDTDAEPDAGSPDDVFRALASDRRRRVLSILAERAEPVEASELASLVAAEEREAPALDAPDESRVRVSLVHRHLPVLDDAGLVARDGDDGTVAATDHPTYRDRTFRRLLALRGAAVDDVLAGFADERRRFVLGSLAAEGATTRDALASAIRDRQGDESGRDPAADVATDLHHVHLPKLDELGLLTYDAATGRVAPADRPALREVLSVFGDPATPVTGGLEALLGDLGRAYRRVADESVDYADWPGAWSRPHHG